MITSGRAISFLIITASLHAYLLHAKSLSITTRQSVNEDDFNSNVDSSCSPEQYQLEYYNELYSTNAVNSFSGNAFYYTFKAMNVHKNITGLPTTTTAEDHAIIANITDQSRFTPAGMETINKVVCAQILQELDTEASAISNTALCPWDYTCDYKADRLPHYLFKARCKASRCRGSCSQQNNRHNMCQSHGIHMTVLQMREKCGEWVWSQELLPIACTCTNDVMMKG